MTLELVYNIWSFVPVLKLSEGKDILSSIIFVFGAISGHLRATFWVVVVGKLKARVVQFSPQIIIFLHGHPCKCRKRSKKFLIYHHPSLQLKTLLYIGSFQIYSDFRKRKEMAKLEEKNKELREWIKNTNHVYEMAMSTTSRLNLLSKVHVQ